MRCSGFLLFGLSALGTVGSLASCGNEASTSLGSMQPLEVGRAFVRDQDFRRAALLDSLLEPNNGYAQLRLEKYAVAGGWDELPELNPGVSAITTEASFGSETSHRESFDLEEIVWDESTLLALGKRACELWPSQPLLGVVQHLQTADPNSVGEALGLWTDREGRLGGLVEAEYAGGHRVPAMTCSTCHARPAGVAGQLIHGPASDFDLGAIDAAPGEGRWGPGTVDVTPDGVENPVAIPDLRATRHQTRLHWTGNLNNNLSALAVRIDTLLITSTSEAARPPREIAFALALYIQSLGGPETSPRQKPGADPGADVFERECARCHSGPTGEGSWLTAQEIGTDPQAAMSRTRGTGGYRVPSLLFVSERHRFTHEGWAGSLAEFISSARRTDNAGHRFGVKLNENEQEQLLQFLNTF